LAVGKDLFREYSIPFIGLKEGRNVFKFDIDDQFFKRFESESSEEFTGAKVQVEMVLDKKLGFLTLDFLIEGTIGVVCDRCGNEFNQELLDEHRVYVKFSDNAAELEEEEDVIYLQMGDSHLNVAKLLYEFILLSVPVQKICPPKENGESGCNENVIKLLGNTPPEKGDDNNDEDTTDPRWSALKKLK
jgi:uncharacterized metal-binding protein YceD (DUF177 family)